MRVMTYNVLTFGARSWMRPWQRRYLANEARQDLLVDVMREHQATIVGMQEVWNPGVFHELGRAMDMNTVVADSYYPARCGLLTPYPIVRHRTHWYRKTLGGWGRSFLEAELRLGYKRRLTVFVVHLPVHSTEMLHSVAFFDALQNRYTPEVVVVGDFNCLPHMGVPRKLVEQGFVDVLAHTEESHDYRKHIVHMPVRWMSPLLNKRKIGQGSNYIDYIFVPEHMSHAIETGGFLINPSTQKISDHYPLIATFNRDAVHNSRKRG